MCVLQRGTILVRRTDVVVDWSSLGLNNIPEVLDRHNCDNSAKEVYTSQLSST